MDTIKKTHYLTQMPLFATLSEQELAQLAASTQVRRVSKYQFVFMPDESADYLCILTKGRVKIGTFAYDGREVIKEIMTEGAVFGELALAGEAKRADFAQVLQDDAEMLVVTIQDMQRLMRQNQTLMFAFMHHMAQRLQRVEERLAKLVLKDARSRIVEFLVETAGREGRRVGYETLVKHHLTQQDIANLTGTSRQTVTSVFNDLRKSNLIHFNRSSVLIRDMTKLA